MHFLKGFTNWYPPLAVEKGCTLFGPERSGTDKVSLTNQGQSSGFRVSAQLEELTVARCNRQLLGIQSLHQAARFALDLLLKKRNGVEKLFGSWRASRDIHVDRDYLVYSLHNGIVVKHPA